MEQRARHLRSHPDEFLAYLNSAHELRAVQEALQIVQWAFYDVNPERAPALYRSKKSRVCGLAWGKGTMAYRCRNCQTSDSSCLCLACFEEGDHTGHDYALYNSGYGGCCDCGDPLAWKPSGNCRNHGPDVRPDPLPAAVLAAATATSEVLLRYLVDALPRAEMLAVAMSEWLKEASKVSDHLREVLTNTAQRMPAHDGRNPLVSMLLSVSFSSASPRPVLDAATNLCLELMFHAPFKTFFSREFVPSLLLFGSNDVLTASEERQELWLYNLATISSQFFHVEDLVLELCRERNLLHTTLEVAHSLFTEKLQAPGPGTWRSVDATEVPHAAILQRFLSDTRQLLQHPKVLRWFLYGDNPATASAPSRDFALFLECARYLQGAASSDRRNASQPHVEFEGEGWLNAWNLAMPMSLLMDVVAPGVHSLLSVAGIDRAAALHAANSALLLPLARSALEWLRNQPPWPSGRDGGELLTYHIPLCRLLFRSLQLLLSKDQSVSVENAVSLSGTAQWLDLADGAARIFAGVGGVRAGLWKRNGERSMMGQANLYRTAYWSVGADIDLYALQCAAIVAGPNATLPFLLSHFGSLAPLVDLKAAAPSSPSDLVMMEEALACVAAVACNRTYTGAEAKLRKEVVHQLALKELSRGQLLIKLSFEFRHESDAPVDQALRDVAEHTGGGADGTGRYRLRREAWAEVDPFYPFYSRADSQAVHERYTAVMKSKRPILLPFPRPIALLPPYTRLTAFAVSSSVWRLFYAVLHAVSFRTELAAEALLEVTLYFLASTLAIAPSSSASPAAQPSPTTAASLSELTWRSTTAAEMLAEDIQVAGGTVHSMASLLAGLLQRSEVADRHEAIERLLRAANLQRLLPQKPESATDEASRRKAEAAARKAAILAQFQAKQHDFEVGGAEGAEPEDEEEDEELMCVLCKEHGSRTHPLAILATPVRSRQLSLSARAGRLSAEVSSPATPANLTASAPLDSTAQSNAASAAERALRDRVIEEESTTGSALASLMPSNDPALVSFLVSLLSRDQRVNLLRQAGTAPIPEFSAAIGRNPNTGDAVILRTCGHAMHASCATRHLEAREAAVLNAPPTLEDCLLDVGDGEMLCPLCRQLTSALVPIIDDQDLPLSVSPQPPPLDGLAKFLATPPPAVPPAPAPITLPVPSESDVEEEEPEDEEDEGEDEAEEQQEPPARRPRVSRFSITALSRRLYARTQELLTRRAAANDLALSLHATAVFVQQISALELAARSQPTSPLCVPRSQRAFLTQILKNVLAFASQSTTQHADESAQLRATVRIMLGPAAPNDSTLLCSDAFSVLVHWLFYCAPRPIPSDLSAFIALLYLSTVMQSLLLTAYSVGKAVPSSSPSPALNFTSLQSLFGSLAAHVGIAVPPLPEAELSAHVDRVSLPFLARVRLLLELLDALPVEEKSAGPSPLTSANLLRALRLPDVPTLLHFASTPVLAALATRWLPLSSLSSFSSAKFGGSLAWALEWRPSPVRFIPLPDNFQELFHRYKDWKCPQCNTAAQDTALCLHCSRLLCVGPQLTCCRDGPSGLGEVFRHAIDCSAGLGLFLLARQSGVLIIAGRRSVLWGSVYLDSHDEPDLLFKRGKPLHLSTPLMEKLIATIAEHRQEEVMFRSGANTPNILRGQPAIVTTRL